MAYQKQNISFQQAARMATIFSDEVIKSFKKLIGRKIYKQDRETVRIVILTDWDDLFC